MLKITQHEEVWWPVVIRKPREDGSGNSDKFKVEIKYRLLTRSDAQLLIPEDDGMSDSERLVTLVDRVCDHILGWKDIDLEYSPENVRLAMDKPYFSDPVISGLRDASAGGRAKN